MRLLTHNGLTSPLPPHSTPLKILPTTLSLSPPTRSPNSPDDSTFVRSLLQKSRVDYFAVVKALEDIRPCLSQISCEHLSLPPELPEGEVGEEVVGSLVTLLLQIRVMEGELLDEVTGRRFDVKGGIANMMLLEDEVGEGAAHKT